MSGGAPRAQTIAVETTYWPAGLGPYLWLEFDAARAAADLDALRHAGFTTARVHLAWDAFMPGHRQVAPARLRDFEALLRAGLTAGVRIVPVLFVQTIGDVVMLPRFAVDHQGRGRGLRIVCDGHAETGVPRDVYADPRVIEAALVWMDTMLSGFANHPAIAAWDLGHDPATAVRPRRTADFTGWVAELAGRVRAQGDLCRLTLGAGDVLTARAVRLSALAAHLDRIDIAVMPQRLRFGSDWPQREAVVFLAQLVQRLAGDIDVGFDLCVAAGPEPAAPSSRRDPGIAGEAEAAAYVAGVIPALAEVGAAAAGLWPSHAVRGRAAASPPFDRYTSLAAAGLFDTRGELSVWGEAAGRCARDEIPATASRMPWPPALDERDYYASLPDSTKELFTSWRSGGGDSPAIVI